MTFLTRNIVSNNNASTVETLVLGPCQHANNDVLPTTSTITQRYPNDCMLSGYKPNLNLHLRSLSKDQEMINNTCKCLCIKCYWRICMPIYECLFFPSLWRITITISSKIQIGSMPFLHTLPLKDKEHMLVCWIWINVSVILYLTTTGCKIQTLIARRL